MADMRRDGKVGIRRKFQTNHLPQLVCLANSSVSAGGVGGAGGGGVVEATQYTAAGPGVKMDGGVGVEAGEQEAGEEQDFDGYRRTVGAGVTVVEKHEDVDILDGVKLDEDQEVEEQQALSNVDQAILLALCAWNRRNRARDEMNRETQAAIVDRVMLHPTNWIVFTTCLLSRCRIELSKTQTVDRACMQMQVLSEQYFDEEPGVSERVAFVYSVPFPPRWSLKKELPSVDDTLTWVTSRIAPLTKAFNLGGGLAQFVFQEFNFLPGGAQVGDVWLEGAEPELAVRTGDGGN